MATIKSYTDINQSCKLEEILPLESADMCWQYQKDRWVGEPDYEEFPQFEHAIDKRDIPCWSLAALVGVIPQEIFDGEYIINITEGCDNRWVLTYDHYENRNHSYYGLSTSADNLVDACYEMILKLNELKML